MDKPVSEMVLYYCGERVDQMERDRLIEVVGEMARENQRLREADAANSIARVKAMANLARRRRASTSPGSY